IDPLKIYILGISNRSKCQQALFSSPLSAIPHKLRESTVTIRRRGNSRFPAARIFPVQTITIQVKRLYDTLAVLGKSFPVFGRCGHLAEATAPPSANRK